MKSPSRKNIAFKSGKNILRGWFYEPASSDKLPCIIMSHGYSALKEHMLDEMAVYFVNQGFCVLVYDQPNFGDSGGEPRLEVDSKLQVEAYYSAIDFVETLTTVDSHKIAIWGTSFSGGLVLVVAAMDKRVKCVVSQVPFITGRFNHTHDGLNNPQWQDIKKIFEQEQSEREQNKPPKMFKVVTTHENEKALIKSSSGYEVFTSVAKWPNEVTLLSLRNSGTWDEPAKNLPKITIPLLIIATTNDTITPTDITIKAFQNAFGANPPESKKMTMIEGDHWVVYLDKIDICKKEAAEFFMKNLSNH
jgi:dipeptidyl aminopeptidase/acylaminoacyl peptidase